MIEMNMTKKTVKALEEMMMEAVRESVTYLADEYSFDAEEALAKVSINCVTQKKTKKQEKEKEKKEKFVKPAFALPFCNAVVEGRCGGICLNNRLYTQCLKPAGENGLCAACNKQAAANEHGKPNYGLIYERVDNAEWTDPKGKAPVRYASVMLKQSIEKDAAVEEAAKFGWTIDEIQFEVEEKKEKKKAAAKRGRPAKTKGVETGGAGDDLIAQLVAQAQQEQGGADEDEDEDEDETKANEPEVVVAEEPEVVEQPKPAKKQVAKKPKKTAEEKEAEKQAMLKAKEEEKAAKLAFKEAEKQARLQAKEAEKQAKLQAKADAKAAKADAKAAKEAEKKALAEKKAAEKKAKEQVKANVEVLEKELTEVATKAAEEIVQEMGGLEVNDGELNEEEEEEEEEEATEVVKFEVDGKTYLKDNEGVLYDMETQDAVGAWNEKTNQIDEIENDSDEEEELE